MTFTSREKAKIARAAFAALAPTILAIAYLIYAVKS